MKVEIYKDTGKSWRWRIRSPNSQVVAGSQESFASYSNAKRAAHRFVKAVFQHSVYGTVEFVEK